MSDLPLQSEVTASGPSNDRTNVLWSGLLIARGQELNCVIESIGPQGAVLQITERFDFGSKAVLRNDRFGDLAAEILWHEGYLLEVKFKTDPSELSKVLADFLP